MKIAITSDWQFDLHQSYSRGLVGNGYTSRLQDQVTAWRWVVDTAASERCTALYVLGDLFDRRTSIDLPVLHAVAECLRYARSVLTEVVLLAGNHDSYLRSPSVSSLAALGGLATVVTSPTVFGNLACLPWTEGEDDVRVAVQELKRQAPADSWLFGHLTLQGLFPDTGVDPDVLDISEWAGVFLGDVHDHCKVSGAVYCGAPLALNYGDSGKDRGFVVLDTAKRKWKHHVNTVSPRFHTIKTLDEEVVAAVTAKDFVRLDVALEDNAIALEVFREIGAVVRDSVPVLDVGLVPRIAVAADDSQEQVLKKYLDYTDVPEATRGRFLAAGLKYLAEGVA